MDKFLKYGMGIMGLLLLQMVEVKGDGTDTETGYCWVWLVLALALLLCSVLSILTQLCQIWIMEAFFSLMHQGARGKHL